MTTREALHHLVDQLPEDQVDLARHWLEDLRGAADDDGPALDAATLGIARPRPRRRCRRPGQAARTVRTRPRPVSYRVIIAHEAEKILDRLDRPTELRIRTRIIQLSEDPFGPTIGSQRR